MIIKVNNSSTNYSDNLHIVKPVPFFVVLNGAGTLTD
jgi:hypothetical protein